MTQVEKLSQLILNNATITDAINKTLKERYDLELAYLSTEERLQDLADSIILELVNGWNKNTTINFNKEVMVEEHFSDSKLVVLDVIKNSVTTNNTLVRIELDPEVTKGGYLITIGQKDLDEAIRVKCHRDFIKGITLLTESGNEIKLEDVALQVTTNLMERLEPKE